MSDGPGVRRGPGRPRKAPEQLAEPPCGPRRRGRTEQAVEKSLQSQERRDVRFAGLEAVALATAQAIDMALAKGEPYPVAQLAPRMVDALARLNLVPVEETPDDGMAALFDRMSISALVNGPRP